MSDFLKGGGMVWFHICFILNCRVVFKFENFFYLSYLFFGRWALLLSLDIYHWCF